MKGYPHATLNHKTIRHHKIDYKPLSVTPSGWSSCLHSSGVSRISSVLYAKRKKSKQKKEHFYLTKVGERFARGIFPEQKGTINNVSGDLENFYVFNLEIRVL